MKVGRLAGTQLLHGVDTGGLEQVRVLLAHAANANQVGAVHPLENLVFGAAGLLGERLAALAVAARLQEAVRRLETAAHEGLAVLGADAFDRRERRHGLDPSSGDVARTRRYDTQIGSWARRDSLRRTRSVRRWRRVRARARTHPPGVTVMTSAPSSPITNVCSNWAVRLPSRVTAVQPSSHITESGAPRVSIGSIVNDVLTSSGDLGPPLEVVRNLQIRVEFGADTMADELAHDAEAVLDRMSLDRPTDEIDRAARTGRLDTELESTRVSATRRTESGSTSPTRKVADVSPWTPPMKMVTSMLMMSPSASGRSRGCHGRSPR